MESAQSFQKSIKVAIALGSNLGDSKAILDSAINSLDQALGMQVEACSSWYKTIPVGPPQPDYLNGCALLYIQNTPQEFLTHLLQVEKQFGRVRREKNGPRTLDLDILLIEDLILTTPDLQVPHPRMRERAFVLIPLAEIVPHWLEPITKKTIAQLSKEVDRVGCQRLYSCSKKMRSSNYNS